MQVLQRDQTQAVEHPVQKIQALMEDIYNVASIRVVKDRHIKSLGQNKNVRRHQHHSAEAASSQHSLAIPAQRQKQLAVMIHHVMACGVMQGDASR